MEDEDPSAPKNDESAEAPTPCFWYYELVPISNFPDANKKWYSKNELIKTDEIHKEFSRNILTKVELLSFEQYIELKEKQLIREDTRFMRQEYSAEE